MPVQVVKEAFSSHRVGRFVKHLIRQRSDVTGPALPVTHLAVFIMIPSQTAWAEALHPNIAQPWKCDLGVCL